MQNIELIMFFVNIITFCKLLINRVSEKFVILFYTNVRINFFVSFVSFENAEVVINNIDKVIKILFIFLKYSY